METWGRSRSATIKNILRLKSSWMKQAAQKCSKFSTIAREMLAYQLKGIQYKEFKNQNSVQNKFPLKFPFSTDQKFATMMPLAKYVPRTLWDRIKLAHIGGGNSFLIIQLDDIIKVLRISFLFLFHSFSDSCVLPQLLGQNG